MLNFACSVMATRGQFYTFGCSCECQAGSDPDNLLVDAALEQASDMIAILSGMRVFGRCLRTVVPMGSGWCAPWPRFGYGFGYDDAFGGVDVIPLRGPETDVVAVTIDGVALPPSAYQLIDGRFLMRIDGEMWPRRNSLNPNDAGQWTIMYRFGFAPDKVTSDAVIELACELVKDYQGRKSNLPPGVTSLNIQGAGLNFQEETDALREGNGNLPAVARFLGVYNPDNRRDTIGIWSPELSRGWELYAVSGPSGS